MSERREWWVDSDTMKLYASDPTGKRVHVREVLPGDVTLSNDESLSYQAQYIDVCDQLVALRSAAKQAATWRDSTWMRDAPSVWYDDMNRLLAALTESEAGDE